MQALLCLITSPVGGSCVVEESEKLHVAVGVPIGCYFMVEEESLSVQLPPVGCRRPPPPWPRYVDGGGEIPQVRCLPTTPAGAKGKRYDKC